MCLCCCCCRKDRVLGGDKYPRFRLADLLVVVGLVGALCAVIAGKPWVEDVLWRSPMETRAPPLEQRVTIKCVELFYKFLDSQAGVETEGFDRTKLSYGAPEPVDEGANALARATAAAREQAFRARAEAVDAADDHLDDSELDTETPLFVVRDESFGGGRFAARVYEPIGLATAEPLPVVVYLHGGGFVLRGGRDGLAAKVAEEIATEMGAFVVSVDYRLAPENAFPAALVDADDAVAWVLAGGLGARANTSHVVLFGDEAGGNLAVGATILARNRAALGTALPAPFDGPQPTLGAGVHATIALYPWFFEHNTQSSRRFGEMYLVRTSRLNWCEHLYRQGAAAELGNEALVTPIGHMKDLEGLPMQHVYTCGNCPLLEDGSKYVSALKAAGVPVDYHHQPDCVGDFINIPILWRNHEFWDWLDAAIHS